MNKILLIIKREYLTRVAKKSFIVLTFITPLLFAGLIFVPLWLTTVKDSEQKVFEVFDDTGKYLSVFHNSGNYVFNYHNEKGEISFSGEKKNSSVYAFIHISDDLTVNPGAITVYSEKTISVEEKNFIKNILEKYLENEKLESFNIPNIKEIIKQSEVKLNISTIKIKDDGTEEETSGEMAMIIAIAGALLIYMFIFMYGSQVMNSVSEEKTNRIVEVIISSVKPFQLMMGKIIGTALVGLTQFFLWIVFTGIILIILNLVLGVNAFIDANAVSQVSEINMNMYNTEINTFVVAFFGIDWLSLFVYFIIYFLGGYLLYSSLFAAIGAAVDTSSDSQQFVLPVTLPLIFALYAAIYGVQNPEGPLLFWCSMIPLTSPIAMMVRIPFEVPVWQLLLSISFLIISFVFSTWISGKIYRTGILMYGKKVNYKEILKWLRYKS